MFRYGFLAICLSTLGCDVAICTLEQKISVPMLQFSPGFSTPGEYEIFGEGQRLIWGKLDPNDNASWNVDESAPIPDVEAIFETHIEGKTLQGLYLSPGRLIGDVEVRRDGETVGSTEIQWSCLDAVVDTGFCPQEEACKEVLAMGDPQS